MENIIVKNTIFQSEITTGKDVEEWGGEGNSSQTLTPYPLPVSRHLYLTIILHFYRISLMGIVI